MRVWRERGKQGLLWSLRRPRRAPAPLALAELAELTEPSHLLITRYPPGFVPPHEAARADGRPPAPPWYEAGARELYPIEMEPERYVALEAHTWLVAGPLQYAFANPEVDAWMRRVKELLDDPERLPELRQQWLTRAERRRVRREERRIAHDVP